VQRHAVLGGVSRGQAAVGDRLSEAPAPGLIVQVVVDAVAERQERQAVGHRVEGIAERVSDPAQVPAQAPRARPAQQHAGLPALPHDHIQPVRPPHREQVHHAAAGHPDHVLGQQMGPNVRHVRLDEQPQVGQVSVA